MDRGASSSTSSLDSLNDTDSATASENFSLVQTRSDVSDDQSSSSANIASRLLQRWVHCFRRDECWTCLIIPLTFWLFASMTLIVGFYGSQTLVLGPDSSRLLSANSLFVSNIQVQDNAKAGPMLYAFDNRPQLDVHKNWSRHYEVTLMADYHQEYPIWLNRGSNVTLNYTIWSTGFFDILLAVVKGRNGLNNWISDPTNPSSASAWRNVHGTGWFTFEAKEDADYFFVLGNLNLYDVKVQLDLLFHSKLYNISNADYKCSLQNTLCGVKLGFPGVNFALLTTPNKGPGNQETWYIKLSFGQRWITYLFSLGVILGLAILLIQMASKLHSSFREAYLQQTPLLHNKGRTGVDYGTMYQKFSSMYLQDSDEDGSKEENLSGTHICAVCYDAPRTSFFDPCGHCVTCYPCGVRIQLGEITDSDEVGESGTCPICRTNILQVRKFFAV